MVEEANNLQHFQADYQRLGDDSKESEVVIQSAEQVIATAQVAIAKAQALIQVNEQKLAVARKKLEELETAKTQVQENLVAHSFRLESLQSQLATKRFLSEEELRVQALAEAEKARQQEMQRLQERIRSLVSRIISLLLLFVFPCFSITLHLSNKRVFVLLLSFLSQIIKVIKFLSRLYPFLVFENQTDSLLPG